MNYNFNLKQEHVYLQVQNDLKEQIKRKGVKVTVPHYYGCVFSQFYLVPKSTSWNDENEDNNPFLHMEID